MSQEIKCTPCMLDDDYIDDWEYDPKFHHPCNCPVCGGWLKWEDKGEKRLTPVCNKCGTELILLPELEDGEETGYGKICPISKPKKSLHSKNKKETET